MPKYSPIDYARALYDAVHESNPKDHDVVLDNFVKVLAQNGDLAKHAEIEEQYKLLDMKEKGMGLAQVTVAEDLEINRGLINQLNDIVGQKLEIKTKVDKGLVGGVIVRVDDTLIDASIRTQLDNLNKELRS